MWFQVMRHLELCYLLCGGQCVEHYIVWALFDVSGEEDENRFGVPGVSCAEWQAPEHQSPARA